MERDVKIGSEVIGTMLDVKRKPSIHKVTGTFLSGQAFIQTVGDITDRRRYWVYCPTQSNRDSLDSACLYGKMINIEWQGKITYGYIEDESLVWKEWRDEHGVCSLTLVVEREQSA